MGACSLAAYDGSRYFLSIVDDLSWSTWIYMLKSKSDARPCLQSFSNLVETHFNAKIKVLRSDNGLEFQMIVFYSKKGIVHQRSCVETPPEEWPS